MSASQTMITRNRQYQLEMDPRTGSIISLTNGRKELISAANGPLPLFAVRFRDQAGQAVDIDAGHAPDADVADDGDGNIRLEYRNIGGRPVNVTVVVRCPPGEPMCYWRLNVDNRSELRIEWVEFPGVAVPGDLVAAGGDARILWPAMEGALIEDAALREHTWLKYQEPGYPSKGWEGIYPGPSPTQFMAYYGSGGGLYLGAHDPQHHVKSIEYVPAGDAVKLQYRLFAGGSASFDMEFDMALGVFEGDWHDAADIYRSWYEASGQPKPPKIADNPKLPDWYNNSPVVITYPVRGTRDTGNMEPNEYFPYVNAMPHVRRLAEQFDSQVMVLLMHWEGTAPWAPPYVWPPFGGDGPFREFADALHREGHLLGVYCSGIAWTEESLLVPEYSGKERLQAEGLADIMCMAPDGSLRYSIICGGTQRWGYDMCPANGFVARTVEREVRSILDAGCDYIQFFDQNLGGLSYFCYSNNHGHGPAPGKWQTDAMLSLFKRLNEYAGTKSCKPLIGCEAAAAEPFIGELPFNDNRFNLNFSMGVPVPLYQYVYHEYINNFMGNQNTSCATINLNESPDNLLWRLAYSFVSGDMLTVVLADGGQVHWDWGTPWTTPKPDQEETIGFIRRINAWRQGYAKPYLCHGRMEKPHAVDSGEPRSMRLIWLDGAAGMNVPPVLSSCWSSQEGKKAQLLVNYTAQPREVAVGMEGRAGQTVVLVVAADGSRSEQATVPPDGRLIVALEPLSACLLEEIG